MRVGREWVRTFVLEEIAHAGAPGEDELGHILDDLGLLLGRQGGEPFGEALKSLFVVSHELQTGRQQGGRRDEPLCPAWTGGSGSWGHGQCASAEGIDRSH